MLIILNLNNNKTKFVVQQKTKRKCSPIVNSIHLHDKAQNIKNTQNVLQIVVKIEHLAC
jgi:hypothetical protein